MRLPYLMIAVLLATGCSSSPRDQATVPVSGQEQVLLAQITRDPYLVITSTWRDDEGHLVIETRQGNGGRTYVLAPDVDGAKDPLIRRRVDDFQLPAVEPGPEPARGLQRAR
jgi:hypothetical protein